MPKDDKFHDVSDGEDGDIPSTTTEYSPSYRNINFEKRPDRTNMGLPSLTQPGVSWSTAHTAPIPSVGQLGPNYQQLTDSDRVVHVLRDESLKSWNLKFTGESDVTEFFYRIDDFMRSREVPERKILKCFADLLGGKALDYYRIIRDNVTSLADLISKFRGFFTPIDSNFALEKSIREHRQSSGQLLSLYILEMQSMNSRLSVPLSEGNLIEIIKHNLSPAYASLLAVSDINTLDQLITLGKRFEAYSGSSPSTSQSVKQPKHNKQVTVVNSKFIKRQTTSVVCKKCKKTGHSYKQCRTIPGIVCFGCGKKDVLTFRCPICHPSNQQESGSTSDKKPKN